MKELKPDGWVNDVKGLKLGMTILALPVCPQEVMMVIATGCTPLLPFIIIPVIVLWEGSPWLRKNVVLISATKKLQDSVEMYAS